MTESDKREIVRLRAEGKGYIAISKIMGISQNTIKSYCKRNTVATAKPDVDASTSDVTACENCGEKIVQLPKLKPRRFCCDLCRNKWWNSHLDQVQRKAVYKYTCAYCGKKFQVYGNSHRKYCCHACYVSDRFGGSDEQG